MRKWTREIARANPQWSDAKLRSHSKTLLYEYQSLCGMAARLASGQFRDDPIVENALVESFAIHCRGLVAFFFAHDTKNQLGRVRDTDVLAAGYFRDGAAWADHCPPFSPVLTDAKWQADKQVAHITAERRELNQPGGPNAVWRVSEIHTALGAAMQVFIEHVPDGLFAPDVKTDLRVLLEMTLADRSSPTRQAATKTQARTTPVMSVQTMTLKEPHP